MNWRRLLPGAFVVGLLLVGASRGPQLIAKVRGMIQAKMQRGELQETARLMRSDAAEGKTLPRPGRPDELAAYLRETGKITPDTDVTRDRWQRLLVLERDPAGQLLLRSFGIDGVRDACTEDGQESAESDDICATIPRPEPTQR
jgi:hypothetical protein